MIRVDESHWRCPKCNVVFAYGELLHRKTESGGHKKGDVFGYCRNCDRIKKRAFIRKRDLEFAIASGDAAKAAARRRLEELRDLRELEGI